jgi:hypothetical protein
MHRKILQFSMGVLADETVASEPVWGGKFPANRENYRDSFNFDPSSLQMRGNNTRLFNNVRDEFPKNQTRDLTVFIHLVPV